MIQTGLPEIETVNQINFIAKKYGVRYYQAGCIIEKSRLDSIKNVNDSNSKIVASKYGKNWEQNIRSQLDTIYNIREIAYEEMLLRKISHDEMFYYLVIPGLRKDDFLVKVYGISYESDTSQLRDHYNIGVDYKKKIVTEFSKIDRQQ